MTPSLGLGLPHLRFAQSRLVADILNYTIMTTVNIKCSNPTIINNPNIQKYIVNIHILHFLDTHEYVNYSINNIKSLLRKLSLNRHSCNYDNISSFYAVTTYGEIIPLYILVPCNKCLICQDKKIQQWQFRAIAEKNISLNNTYMVTLTFNDRFLPVRGVDVRHVQLFMKRLRHNLDKLSILHNIKYLAVGEYGSNFKRPHYHIILWHFPDDKFKNLADILHFIERSWSVYDYHNQEHVSIGYAYCTPTNKHSVKYALKYLFKQPDIPHGMNPNFHTCSRGIGLQYFLDNYDFFKANPNLISLSITDFQHNQILTSPFPEYYKYKMMPSTSLIFPKQIIDSYKIALDLHTRLQTLCDIKNIPYNVPDILYKYYDILYDCPYDIKHPLKSMYIDSYYNIYYNTFYNQELEDKYLSTKINFDTIVTLLTDYYNQNINKLRISRYNKNKRLLSLSRLPEVRHSLHELLVIEEKKYNKLIKSKHREIF